MILTLRNRYIPALMLIALFSTLVYVNVNDIMKSIKNDGMIIKISGRQRMLSQKLILVGKGYLDNPDKNAKEILIDNIKLFEESHEYLIKIGLSPALKKIYYEQKLDKDIKEYIKKFYAFIESKDSAALTKLRIESHTLLTRLNEVVKVYEKEGKLKLQKLENREKYLYIITLFVLLFEALFIFYPASKKIKENTLELEKAVEDRTKELQKSLDIVSKYVIYSRTDLKGIITYASEAFCEVSGYSKEELLGKPHNIIRHPDMPKEAFKQMWDTIKAGKAWSGEVKNLKKDGGVYWVLANISPEYDNAGNIIGYAGVRHNITSEKEIEELNANLEKRVQEEVEKNKEKQMMLYEQSKSAQMSEMIINIAHNWRQPLSIITTAASGLKLQKEMDILTDDIYETSLENILLSSKYLSKTLDKFSSLVNEDMELKDFILQEKVDAALDLILPALKEKEIKLTRVYSDEKIKLHSMPNELSKVILNIVTNSKEALLNRKIKDPLIDLHIDKHDKTVLITIEDNAGGINDDIMPKIFDPYFTTKHQSVGTGMGLHISYVIVTKALNGKIYAKNSNNGVKFYIEIPV